MPRRLHALNRRRRPDARNRPPRPKWTTRLWPLDPQAATLYVGERGRA